MNTLLGEELEKAQQGGIRLKKVEAMLNSLRYQKEDVEERVYALKKALAKESYDVWKLENKNLSSVFYSALGTLKGHEAKEKEEALRARLKCVQAEKDLEKICEHIKRLEEEKAKCIEYKNEFKRLFKLKKDELMRGSASNAEKILELSSNFNTEWSRLKEINEAVDAGKAAVYGINDILKSLKRSERWGNYDMLKKRGFSPANIMKGSNIDIAKTKVENTQILLRNFKTELADIDMVADPVMEVEIGGFALFADRFFDGLITDWITQTEIYESENSVENAKDEVEKLMIRLERMQEEQKKAVEKIKEEYKSFIIKS